jgi:hypothetical protein
VGAHAVEDPKSKRPNRLAASSKVDAEKMREIGGLLRSGVDNIKIK